MKHIASNPTHPRIDVITNDDEVLTGTPTGGATLENRLGAPNVPSDDVQAYVLIPASSGLFPEGIAMMNLWTPELDAAVARIEASL